MDDLISRKSLLKKTYMTDVLHTIKGATKSVEVVLVDDIEVAPSAFEGMTVGEALKAVLGIEDEQIVEAKYLVSIYPKGNHYDPFIAVKRDVWNAPYKAESEEK